jgi:hypothetical protein
MEQQPTMANHQQFARMDVANTDIASMDADGQQGERQHKPLEDPHHGDSLSCSRAVDRILARRPVDSITGASDDSTMARILGSSVAAAPSRRSESKGMFRQATDEP